MSETLEKVKVRNRDIIFKRAVSKLKNEKPLNKEEMAEVERRESERNPDPRWSDSFDSLKAMSGAMGIPMSILQIAKEKGCTAFRGSRVYWKEWLRWHFNGNDSVVIDWDSKQKELDYKDRLLDHEEKLGKKADVETVLKFIREILIPVRQAWLGMAANLASRVNPSDPSHAQKILAEWTEQQMRLITDASRAKMGKRKK